MPKRANYTSIQYSHTVPSPGYSQPTIRTEFEYVMPHMSSDLFVKMAEQDGTVVKMTANRMDIEYKDGSKFSYPIGDTKGETGGTTYKHSLISDLHEGSKFKKGEPIYYHKDFYERDWLDKTKLVFKTQKVYNIAIMTNSETFEDSSAISKRVMKEMSTIVLKPKVFTIPFSSNIDNICSPGTEVTPTTALFTNLGTTENAVNLAESTISMLETLSASKNNAEFAGLVERIEIKYNGDIEDMSPTLQRFVRKQDKETYERTKGTRYEAKNNRVNGDYMSKGKKLDLDMIEIKFFIETELFLETGGKAVYGNQAKSVIGEVFNYEMTGEKSLERIDGMFAYIGFVHRIIDSPFLIGTTNRLVSLFSKKVADEYFK